MRNGRRAARILCLIACLALLAGSARAEEKAERLPDRVLMRFYEHSLFVGDSQIRNLGNYFRNKRKKDPDFFPGVKCYGAYSLQMRMLARKDPVADADVVQLTYKGRSATLTQIARAEKPDRVFILIGLNDRIYEHIDRAENYFDKILLQRDEYYPETELVFMSLTPVTDKWKQKTRDKIVEYNEWLKEKCEASGATYMDIREGLTDEEGCLPKKITTDAESHLNEEGFDILIRTLLDYAQGRYEDGMWIPEEGEGTI